MPRSAPAAALAALACCAACSALTPFGDFRLAADAAPAEAAADLPPPADAAPDLAPTDDAAPDDAPDDAAPDDAPPPLDAAPDDAPLDALDAADVTLDVADVTLDADAPLDHPWPDAPLDAGPLDLPVVDLPTPCPAGQQRCDGACVSLASNAAHCGVCGVRCAAPHATLACLAGRCVVTACAARRGDCNGLADDGCEADLRADPASCGVCGITCAYANAAGACREGLCALDRCLPGFGDCDGNPANGCEVDLTARADHCGACRASCARPFATAACTAGRCDEPVCLAGRGDCDGALANGCETDTLQSPAHCGACRVACAAGQVCAGGVCQGCPSPTADCDGDNTCETRLDQLTHCGACRRACATPNATPRCAGGACQVAACNAGFADCDGSPANGCEVNVLTSAAHCGACGRACAAPNATSACVGGACQVTACPAGRADCNRAYADGCEAVVASNPASCGACSNRCASNFCRGAECVSFGGALGLSDHPSCGGANFPNPYTGAYGCAPGTTAAAYRRIIDCPAGTFTGANLYLCGTPGTVTAFAGAYQVVACGASAVCVPNPYTGGCACPAGSTPTAPMNLYADAPGCGGLHPAQLVFCMRSAPGPGFGGAWQRRDDGLCMVPNPLAAGCNCPAGFGALSVRAITHTPVVYGTLIGVCVR